jgi:protocatechuate 3,4-dioxygenase beta subunit
VVDPDGRPVSGAQVAPLPMTSFHVLTDSEGRFDVGWSPEWHHGLDHELCLMARHVELNLAAMADIAPEAKIIDIKLEPALALRGTVEDLDGTPIQGAQVQLSMRKGWYCGTPVKNVIADDKGRYEFPALPQKQEYGNLANAEGYWNHGITTGIINKITDYEEVGSIILKKPILSVSGVAVDGGGKPVANIPVYFRGAGQPRLDSRTDAQGRFRFDKVCSGPVQINAKNGTLFGAVETQGGAKDVRLVVGPRFEPQPDNSLGAIPQEQGN